MDVASVIFFFLATTLGMHFIVLTPDLLLSQVSTNWDIYLKFSGKRELKYIYQLETALM